MHVVLYQPEIPQNTGNIARTCAVTATDLHLIRPLGFSISDKYLRRAGLDYWHLLNLHDHKNFEEFMKKHSHSEIYFCTTKAKKLYHEVSYSKNSFLMFGPETRGIPEEILNKYSDRCIRIPMKEGTRSLNLSNSVAIVLYEALRQNGFENLT
ncbi:MAG: rRNA methylase, putative, group 2 [Clostridiales bacterium]|nr:rRNA methylase, putative, group 2 [Clostridiales bacterium]